jgi:hypothetical protein
MTLQATFLLCDDLAISLTGKFNASGVYTADLLALPDRATLTHLACMFIIEGDLNSIPKFVTVEVKLPGEPAVRSPQTPIEIGAPIPAGRTRWTYRYPLLIVAPTLRPGQIEARVIYDGGELAVTAPWIVVPPILANSPT